MASNEAFARKCNWRAIEDDNHPVSEQHVSRDICTRRVTVPVDDGLTLAYLDINRGLGLKP